VTTRLLENRTVSAGRKSTGVEAREATIRVLQIATIDIALKNLLLPLMQSLKKDGFEVEAAAKILSKETVSRIEKAGIKFHGIEIERNINPLNLLMASRSIHALLSRNNYDIIHLHTPIAAFIGRIIGRLHRVPYIIYTAHGFYFHENMRIDKRLIFKSIELVTCRSATDYLFCQSVEDTMTAIRERFINPERILHIGNGVDLKRFRPDIETSSIVRRELGIPVDAVVITFIGRMVKEKGVLELLDAFRTISERHPDAYLILAGDSRKAKDRDTETEEKLQEIISRDSFRKRVLLTGFVERPEEILCASDVFVLPSHREGLPRTICEAMACGLPVVATEIRGPREQIVNGETGFLVPVRSPESLAEKISRLIAQRGLRISMGEKARRTAEINFDEKKVIETQLGIYRKIREEILSTRSTPERVLK